MDDVLMLNYRERRVGVRGLTAGGKDRLGKITDIDALISSLEYVRRLSEEDLGPPSGSPASPL